MDHRRTSRALALGLALLAACGAAVAWRVLGASDTKAEATPVVDVRERDFQISAPTRLPAGDVRLRVTNDGPDRHELIVVRRPDEAPLPFRRDGLTLDEDALEGATAGGLEPGERGTVRLLDVHLAPGRYQLFCNMSGHYLGGMHRDLVVG